MTTRISTNSRTVWSSLSLTERLFNVVNQSLQARHSLKTAAICHRVHNEKPITPFNGTLQRGRRRTYTFLKTNRSVRIEVMHIWTFKDAILKAILEHKGCKLNPQTQNLLLLKCFNVLTEKIVSALQRKESHTGLKWHDDDKIFVFGWAILLTHLLYIIGVLQAPRLILGVSKSSKKHQNCYSTAFTQMVQLQHNPMN